MQSTFLVKHTPLPVTNYSREPTYSPFDTRFTGLSQVKQVRYTSCTQRYPSTYPTKHQVTQLEHLLGYLKNTAQQDLKFFPGEHKNNVLAALSDAEWAGNPATMKFLGGSFVYFNRSCISASCKTQNVVATAAANAELIEVYRTVKQLVYLTGQLKEVGAKNLTTVLLTDSQSAVDATNKAVSERSKHMAIYIHFIKRTTRKRIPHQTRQQRQKLRRHAHQAKWTSYFRATLASSVLAFSLGSQVGLGSFEEVYF